MKVVVIDRFHCTECCCLLMKHFVVKALHVPPSCFYLCNKTRPCDQRPNPSEFQDAVWKGSSDTVYHAASSLSNHFPIMVMMMMMMMIIIIIIIILSLLWLLLSLLLLLSLPLSMSLSLSLQLSLSLSLPIKRTFSTDAVKSNLKTYLFSLVYFSIHWLVIYKYSVRNKENRWPVYSHHDSCFISWKVLMSQFKFQTYLISHAHITILIAIRILCRVMPETKYFTLKIMIPGEWHNWWMVTFT